MWSSIKMDCQVLSMTGMIFKDERPNEKRLVEDTYSLPETFHVDPV